MPAITQDEAIRRLTAVIPTLRFDDLAEVYNELFSSPRTTAEQARQNEAPLWDRINEHIRKGLYPEEIVSLWNVIYPKVRHVSHDDETDLIHYGEPSPFLDGLD
jgi:hypothetical protein